MKTPAVATDESTLFRILERDADGNLVSKTGNGRRGARIFEP